MTELAIDAMTPDVGAYSFVPSSVWRALSTDSFAVCTPVSEPTTVGGVGGAALTALAASVACSAWFALVSAVCACRSPQPQSSSALR